MSLDNITDRKIEEVDFSDALGKRYLSYAMSTIMSRSLPDVRDGLKPVHRRLLYAMYKLRLDPKSGFKKCARVVGDVIGKYHPHGDTAVYDTLVRLAQGFAVRWPLVDGQGNFGSIDGDNAAAMRYTEAKLTAVSMLLLKDIELDTVDFNPTYDDGDSEPALLPAAFPNLLANGSEGIAVGMATSIPPHNVSEICNAVVHILKYPECSIAKLVDYVQGPDFPTGGTILSSKEEIVRSYTNGRGAFRIRANWEVEQLKHGAYQVIITEIPYQVQKSRLIEKIAELFKNKKLPLLGNIRDESAENLRIILEPKNRTVPAELLMEQLFKLTDLESRFNLNLNVLDENLLPQVMNLKEVLNAFIKHRFNILLRKSNYLLNKIAGRLEILEGLLIAYLNLDEVIRIIREEDEAKTELIKRFSLTDNQAEAILNMRLRSLRKLEEMKIKEERDDLLAQQAELKEIVVSKDKQQEIIIDEMKFLRNEFSAKTYLGKRRTVISHDYKVAEISDNDFIEKEAITVICSNLGWIRALKGHDNPDEKIKYKTGDKARFKFNCFTTDKIVISSSNGKFYTLNASQIERGKTDGKPLTTLIDLESGSKIVSVNIYKDNERFVLCSSEGKGFIVSSKQVVAQTKNGKLIFNVAKDDKIAAFAVIKENDDHLALVNSNRKMIIFPLSEIPEMVKSKGLILQRQNDSVICDITTINLESGLSWMTGSKQRMESDLRKWIGHRAGKGSLVPYGFPKNNKFIPTQ